MSDAQAGNLTNARTASIPPRSIRPLSRKGRAAVLARITALMEFWHITSDELENAPAPAAPAPKPQFVKYRHPISGLTWDGEGSHPQWLRDALLKEGYRVDELRPEYNSAPCAPITVSQTLPESTHWS